MRWLDRAHRLLPADPTFALALAQQLLGQDDARAARLLEPILARHEAREAFYAMAAARLRLGQPEAAAEALSRTLDRHVLPPTLTPLAEAVARAAGMPGWCALTAAGGVVWGPAGIAPVVEGRPTAPRPDHLSPNAGQATFRPNHLSRNAGEVASRSVAGEGTSGPTSPTAVSAAPAPVCGESGGEAGRDAGKAEALHVAAQGRPLLGSPLFPSALLAVDGSVEVTANGGLSGWAWHPGNPDRDPVLRVCDSNGASLALRPRNTDQAAAGLLARPRHFTVSAKAIARLKPPLRVVGPDGADLAGSPLDQHPHAKNERATSADERTLFPARRRVEERTWRKQRKDTAAESVLLIAHDQGGGVERALRDHVDRLRDRGLHPLILRPARHPDGRPAVRIGDRTDSTTYQNLIYALPDEYPALLRLLRTSRPARIVFHHTLGHPPAIFELPTRLAVPYDVHVHDYALLCPRVQLMGAAGRYCGEPSVDACGRCVAVAGSLLDEEIEVSALRTRTARLLASARQIIAPSEDAARRLMRHFPAVSVQVAPHEDDSALARIPLSESRDRPIRVAVVGGLTLAKGFEILCACAEDAARRDLPLYFVVVGHTIDDARLMASGRAHVTGPFEPDEAEALIRAQHAAIAFIPSVWPETWCYALGDVWRAGLRAVAFDIGAPAARIGATGRGIVLPLGLPPAHINRALLAAAGVYRHESAPLAETRTGI